jgi:circadian clock protein KaiC
MEALPLIDSGMIVLTQVDPAELSPGEFVQRIRSMIEHDGARMIVIDSLNGYLHAMPRENYLILQLHELLSYLDQCGVISIIVTAQSGLVGTMQSPIDLTYLADSVVLFRFFEVAGAIKRAVSVIKKRRGRHEQTIREFSFGKDGLRVGNVLKQFQGVLTGIPTFIGESGAMAGSE